MKKNVSVSPKPFSVLYDLFESLNNIKGIHIVNFVYKKRNIPLPFIITKDDDVYVAWCPVLDIATQGNTRSELMDYIEDILQCYFADPDTPKPKCIKEEFSISASTETSAPTNVSEDEKIKVPTC